MTRIAYLASEYPAPSHTFIRREIERGTRDDAWLEEQFQYLLVRLLRGEALVARLPDRLSCARASTRREIARRLGWAVDFMRSNRAARIGS